ncbi:hypothetical protein LshimejAT787_0705600 [Lyophyllum shimeji]|uniref:Uncharacterized protein n=1 Tax=Lyophyllum shimeji TaxID=47721 RepID=A0A9P3PP46_LYOSH|nr:hypothetical protein LshimejAT787_0705600 [Lyophyllum shimeji]
MIISSSVTIGQLTFILRVAIQIVSYAGLALIGVIILGNAPRLAPIDTHDVINRLVGASTATLSTGKWIFSRIRRNSADPSPPVNLLLILFFSLSYTVFVSLSDIGFLGFYACSVPGPDTTDFPASITSDEAASSFVMAHTVNGIDLANLTAWRCDTTRVINLTSSISENNCTAWRTSTYADSSFFAGINSTDSDVLLPRQLKRGRYGRDLSFDVNSFYLGPNTLRLRAPTIQNGIAIAPHAAGVRAVMGVPQLKPEKRVTIPKTMAMEVDVGCMSLGVFAQARVDEGSVDDVRAYLRPFFNESTLSSGGYIIGINNSVVSLSSAAKVAGHRLLTPDVGIPGPDDDMLGYCTDALQKQLGIPTVAKNRGTMCAFLGIGGSVAVEGRLGQGFHRMMCAAATQVNMVSATVAVDNHNQTSLNLTRLPSDLHYVQADFWHAGTLGEANLFINFVPYERYTLSDNPNGPTTHFVWNRDSPLLDSQLGPASGANIISTIGSVVLDPSHSFDVGDYTALKLLDNGFEPIGSLSTARVTEWVGEVAGSFILASATYNGWAARQMPPLLVQTTGGRTGSCYRPYYALGFLPLVFAATVVVCWAALMLLGRSLMGSGSVKKAYGGLAPFTAVASPGAPAETLLCWEHSDSPQFQVVAKDYSMISHPSDTALKYFKSAQSPPS